MVQPITGHHTSLPVIVVDAPHNPLLAGARRSLSFLTADLTAGTLSSVTLAVPD
jgi:hypothetical protein